MNTEDVKRCIEWARVPGRMLYIDHLGVSVEVYEGAGKIRKVDIFSSIDTAIRELAERIESGTL